jgi:hypothetical protein
LIDRIIFNPVNPVILSGTIFLNEYIHSKRHAFCAPAAERNPRIRNQLPTCNY